MAARKRKNQPENPIGFEGRTIEQERLSLRRKVKMFYDIQRLRLQTEGRILPKSETGEIQLHPGDLQILTQRVNELVLSEKNALADVQDHLKTMSFYTDVLSDKTKYRGIGPTMAGIILAEFDIHKADTVSKFWSYAGLAPVPAYRCKVCQNIVEKYEEREDRYVHVAKQITCEKKKDILGNEDVFYSGKPMRPVKGEKLPYNAFLKMKLVGVLGSVLLKLNSPWRKHYDDYKHRKQTAGWGVSDGHRHNAAIRYMIKMLLLDIFVGWRTHEKLPVRPSYHEEKQGGHGFRNNEAQKQGISQNDSLNAEITAELSYVSNFQHE